MYLLKVSNGFKNKFHSPFQIYLTYCGDLVPIVNCVFIVKHPVK